MTENWKESPFYLDFSSVKAILNFYELSCTFPFSKVKFEAFN